MNHYSQANEMPLGEIRLCGGDQGAALGARDLFEKRSIKNFREIRAL